MDERHIGKALYQMISLPAGVGISVTKRNFLGANIAEVAVVNQDPP